VQAKLGSYLTVSTDPKLYSEVSKMCYEDAPPQDSYTKKMHNMRFSVMYQQKGRHVEYHASRPSFDIKSIA
jgi:hypothetical protein